jgi:hypothetical protein
MCCPKIIYFGSGEVPGDVASTMIQIALPAASLLPPSLNEEQLNEIEVELQGKMLAYRVTNYRKIRVPQLQTDKFIHETRELAMNLAACIADDSELTAGLVPLLAEQDEHLRGLFERERQTAIIEAALCCCHENKARVQVKEIAALANTIIRARGENIEYSPEEVGHQLDTLQLFRTRTSAGRFLILGSAARRLVHRVAWDYRALPAENMRSGCTDCRSLERPVRSTVV